MPDTVYLRDIDAMTPVERREYLIGLSVAKEYAETSYYDALKEIVHLRAEVSTYKEKDAAAFGEGLRGVAAVHVLQEYGVKEPCTSFHIVSGKQVCWGTKEIEPCSCGGDKTKCTHYPPAPVPGV